MKREKLFDYHNWKPLSIAEVVQMLHGLDVPWWIAGGYAIELFAGKSFRSHGDIDVLIKRDDQLKVQAHLSDRELYRATRPGLKLWEKDEFLTGRIHDIWCRLHAEAPWKLQLMLFDTEQNEWIFKRAPEIRGDLRTMGKISDSGISYLSPEIQLLYKAKPETIEKDQMDFDMTVPLLADGARF